MGDLGCTLRTRPATAPGWCPRALSFGSPWLLLGCRWFLHCPLPGPPPQSRPVTLALAFTPASLSSSGSSHTMSTARPAGGEPTSCTAAPAPTPTTSAACTRPSRRRPEAGGCAPSASRRWAGQGGPRQVTGGAGCGLELTLCVGLYPVNGGARQHPQPLPERDPLGPAGGPSLRLAQPGTPCRV